MKNNLEMEKSIKTSYKKRSNNKMPRKKKEPSNNFCIICGRYTNKKKFGDDWSNYFYVCNNCKKVWCSYCFAQISGQKPGKAFRLGKKGQLHCPDCGQVTPVIKNPTNLQFIQVREQVEVKVQLPGGQEISSGTQKICPGCKQKNRADAKYCDFCGEALKKK